MWGSRFGGELFSSSCLAALLLLLLAPDHPGVVTAQTPKSPWQTLTGNSPVVIAKGGFSGIFPDSSDTAYKLTYVAGSSDTISWCDVRLTKDGVGICLPELTINNGTNIQSVYPQGEKNYLVNGVPTSGWFSVDYSVKELSSVSLMQAVLSRTDKFDFNLFPILAVEDVWKQDRPPALWLNIQHDMFYRQHNLSMRSYLLSLSKRVILSYVSSPEVTFLSSIAGTFKGTKTKFIFRFLDEATIEPSTNQTYGSLLKNLTFIKTFASGILVPKQYIWPVTSDLYLLPHTSVVLDAHKEGLEVYASGFANDALLSYNYSYDPLAEYLSFIDNGIFSVDGVLTDFPITASEAIGGMKRDLSWLRQTSGKRVAQAPSTRFAVRKKARRDGPEGDQSTSSSRGTPGEDVAAAEGAPTRPCPVETLLAVASPVDTTGGPPQRVDVSLGCPPAADRGKARQVEGESVYGASSVGGRSTNSSELPPMGGLLVPAEARQVLKGTILPHNLAILRDRSFLKVSDFGFAALQQLVYDFTFMEESLGNVDSIIHGLKEELQTARAAREVVEELKQSMEDRLVRVTDEVRELKSELKGAHSRIARQEAGWKRSRKQVESLEQAAREDQEKMENLSKVAEEASRRAEEAILESEATKREAEAAKRESEALRKRIDNAVADFKMSLQFQTEIDEASLYAYQHGFNDGLSKVKETLPHLDLSIIPFYNIIGEEGEVEAEAAGEVEEPPCPEEEAATPVEDPEVIPALIPA